MLNQAIYLAVTVFLIGSVSGAEEQVPATTFNLTESSLVQASLNSSSRLALIRANDQQAQFQLSQLKEKYQWNWVTKAETSDSDEEAIAAFIPTFGPTYTYQTGVQKNFTGGVSMDASLFSNQQSTADGSIDEATRSGLVVGLSIDLWKNLFGRVDRAQLKDIKLQREKSMLQSEIDQQVTLLELRKLYWSLVANDLQIKITNELLKSSQKQLQDAKNRGRQYIADKGEVASYRAQVSSREAVIKNLEYQRDLIVQSLKSQIPEIASMKVELAEVNTDDMMLSVYRCAESIGTYRGVPWEYTKLDELLAIEEDSYEQKKIQTNRYSDIDVQLTSEIQVSGVDQGFSDSFDEFRENGESGYGVGLQITVPLGSASRQAKKSKVIVDYQRFLAEKNRLNGRVNAQQTQIVSMVKLLKSAVKSLQNNDRDLSLSIASNQKKFRQARISLNSLINEQNQLLNTRLTEVDTQLQIIHTIFDYFQTFTNDPCPINQIGARS